MHYVLYEMKYLLVISENLMFNGDIDVDTKSLQRMREKLANLKYEYIKIVGGKDIPIYFGKLQ